jgi:peroxiredoxin family protein
MKSLAIIVSGGSTNNLIQVLTLVMAAVHEDIRTRVLFRDEAVFRLTPAAINRIELSAAYQPVREDAERRLNKLDLTDLHKLLRDLKASGDVQYYVCSSSLDICGLQQADLIAEVDGVRGLPAFLKDDVATADEVLTF